LRKLDTHTADPYPAIKGWERSQAWGVSVAMVPSPRISVWDVMIPIVFILNFLRTRERRELFVQNHLYTKMLALDSAREIMEGKVFREEAFSRIRKKTDEALAAESSDIYSEAIREAQMAEVSLLLEHYLRLMASGGGDYAELVRNAYPNRRDYELFLNRLEKAEQDVIEAARETMGNQVDPAALATLTEETGRLRRKSLQRIYESMTGP
jgi:hypothetical protein